MSRDQKAVLGILASHDHCSLSELVRLLGWSVADTARVIYELERKRLINTADLTRTT